MPKVVEYKFVLPPVILALLILWAHPTISQELPFNTTEPWMAILSGVFAILAVGFVISTLGYVAMNLSGLFPEPENEIEYWLRIGDQEKFVRDQIAKRWDMFTLNLNAIIGVLITVFIVLWKSWNPPHSWLLVITLLTASFLVNATFARRSVKTFERFLLKEKIGTDSLALEIENPF